MSRSGTRSQGRAVSCLAGLSAAAVLLTGCSTSDGPPGKGSSAGSAKPVPPPPESVAAVGDSITRGFDACSLLSDCPEVSWVTGTDARVDSFTARLSPNGGRADRGGPAKGVKSWNLARSGASMADLPRQIDRAVAKRPEMITILMGANDACRTSTAAMTPVAEFRASFERSLRTVQRRLPNTRVLVGSIPDLEHLWKVGRKYPEAKQAWSFGICPSMLARPDSKAAADQARRAAVAQRVKRYNGVLKSSCAKFAMCVFDGGAVHRYRFTARDLSKWDWFHPSIHGQAALARIMYQAAFGKS